METIEVLIEIKADTAELKKRIPPNLPFTHVSSVWIPRSIVMEFFRYGDTQMCALEKNTPLVISQVGKRKFIHRDSIAKLLDNNVIGKL